MCAPSSVHHNKKYEANFKLKVTQMAKETHNCAAAREFDVHEKMLRMRRKNEELLKTFAEQ